MENGQRRKLWFDTSYALIESPDSKQSVVGGPSKQKCPYCNSSYQDLLILNGKDERLSFLGTEEVIRIKICLSCLPWSSPIICSCEGEGSIITHEDGESNFVDDETIEEHKNMILSKERVPLRYCSKWEKSAIGGKPNFIDDAYFAKCPKCGKYMKHLAQLDSECTGYDGTVYIQICTECKTAATWYQQT